MPLNHDAALAKLQLDTIGVVCGGACTGGKIFRPGQDPPFDQCRCDAQFHRQAAYLRAGVPTKYWPFGWQDLTPRFQAENRETLAVIRYYEANIEQKVRENTGLFLHGGKGLGKTGISCIVLKSALDRGVRAAFVNMPVWTRRLFDGMDSKEVKEEIIEERAWLRDYVDFLVIDQIEHVHKSTDGEGWASHQIDAFYNEVVYNTRKAVILTANVAQSQLVATLPLNVVDRIQELAAIEFHGRSFRVSESNEEKIAHVMDKPVAPKPMTAKPLRHMKDLDGKSSNVGS